MMKGIKRSSLYVLDGNIVVGTTTLVQDFEKNESSLTRLWHMRLRHVGEKGMVMLNKRWLLGCHMVAELGF